MKIELLTASYKNKLEHMFHFVITVKILTRKDKTISNFKSWLSTVSNLFEIRSKNNLIFIASKETNLAKWIDYTIEKINNLKQKK